MKRVDFDCSGTKNCLFVLSSTQIYDECVCFIDACAYYITTCYEGGDRCDVSFSWFEQPNVRCTFTTLRFKNLHRYIILERKVDSFDLFTKKSMIS